MILLDTNIVSELMRLSPHPGVKSWIANRPADSLYFSAIGEAELLYGLAVMPAGRRRDKLSSEIHAMFREDFEGRVLPFDSAAARSYAGIAAARRFASRPVAPADCQIAAIAQCRGMAVATRDIRDFENMEIDVIDPWARA